ncbi:cell wall-binding repeat-containing protein [Paenibacillus tengchongensis]|uniref:cell wall-binding repeat-containing protein n=1 Tax=Paenibacillus tengchongensis TaxID=2608684 RepID=UPI00124C902E|nr:cell wall-binding repeat-containing protein [Paenibacillus tengchongensis]
MNKISAAMLSLTLLAGVLAGCTSGSNNQASTDQNGAGAEVLLPWIATKNTTRVNTSDPVEAAVLASRSLWTAQTDSNRPASVILTGMESWQIAAVSADLIHHPSNGPILFFREEGLPESTIAELKRLKPLGAESNGGVQAVLVGPVPDGVEAELEKLDLKVDVITGDDPAEIARNIDAYYAAVSGALPDGVIIGSVDSPEYTLPAVNWIAHMPEPLLYVGKDEIPEATVKALQERGGAANMYVLGPEAAVSAEVARELEAFGRVTRISGDDPYANAIAFAKYKDEMTGFGWGITSPGHNLSFVTTEDPLLATAVAPFSHLGKHAPLIYTEKDGLPDSVMSYTMELQPKYQDSPAEGPYNHAWITGGTDGITEHAQSEIDDMLEISPASGGNPHSGH